MTISLRKLAVAHAAPRLLVLESPEKTPAPGKWSPKEVIGHLVDSATNNTARFVRASLGAPLVFDGYDQDAWVKAGSYEGADWADLVALWRLQNEHLARVLEGIPEDVLDREHHPHALHRIAWRLVSEDKPATLRYFVDDYVGHLRHHLRSLSPDLLADV